MVKPQPIEWPWTVVSGAGNGQVTAHRVLLKIVVTRRSQHSQECHRLPPAVFCASWPWLFDIQNQWVLGLTLEHFYVTFGDPSCIGFKDIMW